jgi:hypothetical protein
MIDLGWLAFLGFVSASYVRARPAALLIWAPLLAAACVAAAQDAEPLPQTLQAGDPVALFSGSPSAVAIAFLGYMIRESARDLAASIRLHARDNG